VNIEENVQKQKKFVEKKLRYVEEGLLRKYCRDKHIIAVDIEDVTFPSSVGAAVHDEPSPLSGLLPICPDAVTFVSNF
jgi:hypothetical protein